MSGYCLIHFPLIDYSFHLVFYNISLLVHIICLASNSKLHQDRKQRNSQLARQTQVLVLKINFSIQAIQKIFSYKKYSVAFNLCLEANFQYLGFLYLGYFEGKWIQLAFHVGSIMVIILQSQQTLVNKYFTCQGHLIYPSTRS